MEWHGATQAKVGCASVVGGGLGDEMYKPCGTCNVEQKLRKSLNPVDHVCNLLLPTCTASSGQQLSLALYMFTLLPAVICNPWHRVPLAEVNSLAAYRAVTTNVWGDRVLRVNCCTSYFLQRG